MNDAADDWVVVYRGTSVAELDMVQDMLRTEGLEPRRRGRANPSLAGAGESAMEQMIVVAPEHADAATELVAASQRVDSQAAAALEAEAMQTEPVREKGRTLRGPGGGTLLAIIAIVLFGIYLWLSP
jgi:ferric-dicitrate binding protein FerR (iron transport regulator)